MQHTSNKNSCAMQIMMGDKWYPDLSMNFDSMVGYVRLESRNQDAWTRGSQSSPKKYSIKVMPRNQFPQEIDMKYGFSLKGIWKLMRQCPDWQLWNSYCFVFLSRWMRIRPPKKWFLAWPFCFYPIWAGPLEPAVSSGCPQGGAEVWVQLRPPLPGLPGHSEQRQAGVQVCPPTQLFS